MCYRRWSKLLTCICSFNPPNSPVTDTTITPLLEVKELRHREVKSPNTRGKLGWPPGPGGDPRTEMSYTTL